jgi:hypothetical protein
MANRSKENLLLSNRSRNSNHKKTDSKTSLMGVIKLYMKDKIDQDKVIQKSSKYLSSYLSPKDKKSMIQKVQQRTYDMIRPVSNFNTTKGNSMHKLPIVDASNVVKHKTSGFSKGGSQTTLKQRLTNPRAGHLSIDQQLLSFHGDSKYMNTNNTNNDFHFLNTDNFEDPVRDTIASINSDFNRVVINKSNNLLTGSNVIREDTLNNNAESTEYSNMYRAPRKNSEANSNVINIVNNVNNRKPSDVVKVKMNVYGINVLVPNDGTNDDIKEQSDLNIVEIVTDNSDEEGEPIDELDGTTREGKLKSYRTFSFTPKMQIDIKRTPVNKTLSLRINNINHSINLGGNNDKRVIRTTDTIKSLSVISSENSKLIKQTTRELYFKDGNTTESVYNNSPVRRSIIRSSSNVDSDLGANTRIRKKVSVVTPNLTEDIVTEPGQLYRGISVKLTEQTESFGPSKYNTDYICEEEDCSEDECYDFIREKVKGILKKIGDSMDDVELKTESKLHTASFIRHVNRSSTLLRRFNIKVQEIKEIMRFSSKSVIVRKSNYINLRNDEVVYKRSKSGRYLSRTFKLSKQNLQTEIMKISLDNNNIADNLKQTFLEMRRNQNLEFKLINIQGLKDLIITESRESSIGYIKTMINHALASKTKKARSKRVIQFYITGLRKMFLGQLLQPADMQPLKRGWTLDLEDLQHAATDIPVSKYLRMKYFDVYPEMLLSIYKNFNNFNNNLGEKVLNSDLFINFRIGNMIKRSSRICVFDFDYHRSPSLKRDSLIVSNFTPFMGHRNENFVHTYVRLDHPNTKADEEAFFNQSNYSDESVDTVKTCKKHASVKFKSDIFLEYMKELKTSKVGQRRSKRASVMVANLSSVKEDEDNSRMGRIKFKKKKHGEKTSSYLNGFRKSRYNNKFHIEPEDQTNPDRPVLNIKENAEYLICSRKPKPIFNESDKDSIDAVKANKVRIYLTFLESSTSNNEQG